MAKFILPHRNIDFNAQVLHSLSSTKHIDNSRQISMFCQGRTMSELLFSFFHYVSMWFKINQKDLSYSNVNNKKIL